MHSVQFVITSRHYGSICISFKAAKENFKRRFLCTLHDGGGLETNLSVIKEASLLITINIQLQIWKKLSTNS